MNYFFKTYQQCVFVNTCQVWHFDLFLFVFDLLAKLPKIKESILFLT